MKRIPFIEKRQVLAPQLSKLFNIVVNYKGLNNPDEVGYCTQIYSQYFKTHTQYDFDEAVNFYFRSKNGLKDLIQKNQRLTGVFANKLLDEIDDYLINGNKDIIDFESIKGNNQYYSYTHKVVSVFWKANLEITNKRIKQWRDSIVETKEFIQSTGESYLFNLLTVESLIGTSIENDILHDLSLQYNVEKRLTDEKLGIDARVNNIRISIKSIKYIHSPYRKVAKQNIQENLKGGIILIYEVIGDSYSVLNIKDLHNLLHKEVLSA